FAIPDSTNTSLFDLNLLLDREQLTRDIADAVSPIPPIKKALKAATAILDRQFRQGADVRELVKARAFAMDQVLALLWQRFSWRESPLISLVAVGGYGRGELHPYSDIDLLILLDNQADAEHW